MYTAKCLHNSHLTRTFVSAALFYQFYLPTLQTTWWVFFNFRRTQFSDDSWAEYFKFAGCVVTLRWDHMNLQNLCRLDLIWNQSCWCGKSMLQIRFFMISHIQIHCTRLRRNSITGAPPRIPRLYHWTEHLVTRCGRTSYRLRKDSVSATW